MTASSDLITALEARARALLERARKVRAQERVARNREARRADTRRKIVLGALVLQLSRRGVIDAATIDAWLREGSLADRDRVLLDDLFERPSGSARPNLSPLSQASQMDLPQRLG